MKFSIEWLQDMLGDSDVDVVNDIVDKTRWSVHYHRVIQFEGHFYQADYSRGATESQDEQPYEYDGDANSELECKEVYPVLKTITVYE